MKKTSIFITIFLVVTLIGTGFLVWYRVIKNKAPDYMNQSTEIIIDDLNIIYPPNSIQVEKTESQPNWYKSLSVERPINSAPGVSFVRDWIGQEIDNFWCVNDDEQLTREEVEKMDNLVSYTCELSIVYSYTVSKSFITHVLFEYLFAGGAHGISNIMTFTFDIYGKQYFLADILKEEYLSRNPKEILSIILPKGIIKDAEENMFDENISLEVNDILSHIDIESLNELPFKVSSKDLIFIFSEGQGLSHASGILHVVVPISELHGILRNELIANW